MGNEDEKDALYGRMKDYPQLIKSVEGDSENLIKDQNKVMSDQFSKMRDKITKSLSKLHLGVIQKTVDQVVQNVLTTDLKEINENINTQFMSRFNNLLGNLITNVDEIVNVGKILDAADKVNEYVGQFLYDDAIALLDLTIELIKEKDLEEQKNKLIERRNEVIEEKKIFFDNVDRLRELEQQVKEHQARHLLNEVIAECEEIIQRAPRIGKLELINQYSPVLESTKKDLDELKKESIMANENFELLVEEKKFVEAHEIVGNYKKKFYYYLENPPIPLVNELIKKEEKAWEEYTQRQREIEEQLGQLENQINQDVDNNDFESGDTKWVTADELLEELYDENLKNKWKFFKSGYKIKKNAIETIRKVTDLLVIFAFEDALTILNTAMEKVIEREFDDYESRLKRKKDDVYAAQAKYNYLVDKIKKYEEKFNENYYKYCYIAAQNYCERIIEIAPDVGRHELVDKYKQLMEDIQKELNDLELEFIREQEQLQSNLRELEGLIEIEEDVLPLLDKFSVDDVLGDMSDDITESLDAIKSLMNKNRVDVKKEITNKAIIKSASGEMVESETEILVQKVGDEDTESITFNVQSVLENPFEDSIEEAILTDLIPYNFEITNIQVNGKPVEQLPDKSLKKDGLELKWEIQNVPAREKLEINYDLRRRVSRTIIFILEGELKVVKTHSTLQKLQIEGFYDAKLPFTNSYGGTLEGVVIEDIVPMYYLHIVKAPTNLLPSEKRETKMGELIKWDIGRLDEVSMTHHYRLLELYRYEEIKIAVEALNKDFINFLDKGELTKAVERFHEIGGMLEEYHATD